VLLRHGRRVRGPLNGATFGAPKPSIVGRPLALRLSALALSAALPCVSACAPPALAAPIEPSTLGPGDLFVMQEDGENGGDVVAPGGTVDHPPKRIEVLGEVMRPGSLSLLPGLTLVRAISLLGGFSAVAAKTRIVIYRRVEGGVKAATISIEDVLDNRIPDPLLQAGDSIQVNQR
jgi:SLBB domain